MKKIIMLMSVFLLIQLTKVQAQPIVVDYSKGFQSLPFDQQNSGTCVACAIAHLKTYQEGKKRGCNVNLPKNQFSPSFIFNSLISPYHKGLEPSEALDFVCKYGCAQIDKMPFNPNINTKPELQIQYSGLSNRNQGWKYIKCNDILKEKEELLNGPNLCAIYISNFSHFVCIVGYSDTVKIGNFTGGFKFLNSFGKNWTSTNKYLYSIKNGYGWIPYAEIGKEIGCNFYSLSNEIKGKPEVVVKFVGNIQNFSFGNDVLNFALTKEKDTIRKISFFANPSPMGGVSEGSAILWKKSMGHFDCNVNSFSFFIESDSIVSDSIIIIANRKMEKNYGITNFADYAWRLDSVLYFDEFTRKFINLNIKTETLNREDPHYFNSRFLAKIKIQLPNKDEKKLEVIKKIPLLVFPNPCTDKIVIDLSMTKSEFIRVELYDVLGRKIKNIFSGPNPKCIEFNTQSLSNGTYLVSFIGKNDKMSAIFIKE